MELDLPFSSSFTWRLPVQAFSQNLRYALRLLVKNPGFTLVIVITLALGIGANTAIFSVVYSALLRPLPYRDPGELLTLGESRHQYDNIETAQVSYPDYLDWGRNAKSVQSFAGSSGDAFTLVTNGEPKNTFAAQITPTFFSTLGVRPMLGRDFLDSDLKADGPHVAILSYAFWRSEFGGDANAVGRVVHLDGKPATIVGVLPREFEFAPAGAAPIWVPIHLSDSALARRSLRWLSVIGRISPGFTREQVRAEMEGINAQLTAAYPKENGSTFFIIGGLRERIVGKVQPLLLVLLGAVGFVLLITCANVANLLLTKSVSRRREFAVRSAMGASRGSLVAQSLTESLLLSFFGALAGLFVAIWGVQWLVSAIPESQLQSMPYLRNAGINIVVLAFLLGITLLTSIVFGVAPALSASRVSLNEVLKDESRGGTSGGHVRLRNTLVVAEIAISLVLLVGAGLLLKSLRILLHQNPGFDAHNVLTFDVNLPDTSYPSDKAYPFNNASAIRFDHEFSERLRNMPGVMDVAATTGVPDNGGSGTIRFVEEGRPVASGQEDECDLITVSDRYFSTLRISLFVGRFFTRGDSTEATPVLIVNRAFAKSYFPNEDAIGKRIRFTYNAKEPYRQIVGIVGDTAQVDLAAPPPPLIYYPNDQGPATYLSYLVRTAGDPAGFIGIARATLHGLDAQLPLIQPQTVEQIASESPAVFLRRYPSYLIGSFAALALTLAVVGLYGLISYMVLQRTREIGIRVALGAQRSDVLRLVVRQGIMCALAGVAIGVACSLGLMRLIESLLYGVTPGDWLTFASVALMLIVVALAACLIPARRAMRVDPTVALRYE